ncbi:hypothetical protein HN011_010408 [Eciton burchellii]|nr:hypothetical protein HN011_010408 [Eciton burchellii]
MRRCVDAGLADEERRERHTCTHAERETEKRRRDKRGDEACDKDDASFPSAMLPQTCGFRNLAKLFFVASGVMEYPRKTTDVLSLRRARVRVKAEDAARKAEKDHRILDCIDVETDYREWKQGICPRVD